MPLLDINRPLYVRRERFYVDSIRRNLDLSRTQFDIVMDLPKRYQNVESLEVTNYNMPTDMAATFFFENSDSEPGNNLLDISLVNDAATQSLDFTVTLEAPMAYETKEAMASAVETQIQTQMDALADPYFVSPAVTWRVELTGTNRDIMNFVVDTTYPATTIFASFLFGTGPNQDRSPAEVFGFNPGEDTSVVSAWSGPLSNVPGNTGPHAYKRLQLQPKRYADLFCRQAEPSLNSGTPLARFFLTDQVDWAQSEETAARPRMFKEPLRYADKLNFKLELEGGTTPASVSTNGWDATMDILTLADETCIPGWLKQRFNLQ